MNDQICRLGSRPRGQEVDIGTRFARCPMFRTSNEILSVDAKTKIWKSIHSLAQLAPPLGSPTRIRKHLDGAVLATSLAWTCQSDRSQDSCRTPIEFEISVAEPKKKVRQSSCPSPASLLLWARGCRPQGAKDIVSSFKSRELYQWLAD